MRNVYRKIGKAHWEYTCPSCGRLTRSVDEFGVYEAKQKHDNAHAISNAINSVFGGLGEAFNTLSSVVGEAFASIQRAFVEVHKNDPKFPTSTNPNRERRK